MASNGIAMRAVENSFGVIEVPADCYYGGETERSRRNFQICMGRDKMPLPLIYALVMIKKVAAEINLKKSKITKRQFDVISHACDDILNGNLDKEFPLTVWQTGSGTQTNMNVNEVIANKASEYDNGMRSAKPTIHPNDHVNCGQSTNDIFPTAMNLCIAIETAFKVLPSLVNLKKVLNEKAVAYKDVVKIGRTHLQDAVPMTVGQEIGAFVDQLSHVIEAIKRHLPEVCSLAVGGTAVGTGLNCMPQFDHEVCERLTEDVTKLSKNFNQNDMSETVQLKFKPAENKFAALAAHDSLVQLSGAFNFAATVLFKIAKDFTLLSSGPSCGLGELILPANEAGSSIMPGKVNPTQCESLAMVSIQLMGNHFTVSMAAAQGQLQLNVFKPIILLNMLHSCQLLTDSAHSFAVNCVQGIQLNTDRLKDHVDRSLMLATALNPHIGYDKSAKLVKYAHENKLTLREAAMKLGFVTAEQFDKIVRPHDMAFPFGKNTG